MNEGVVLSPASNIVDIIVEEEREYDVDKGIGVPILANIDIILKEKQKDINMAHVYH